MSRLHALRPLIAALAAFAVLAGCGALTPQFRSFSVSLITLTLLGGGITSRASPGPAGAALAVLLASPAVGLRAWAVLLHSDVLAHIDPMSAVVEAVQRSAITAAGPPRLLIAATVAAALLRLGLPVVLVLTASSLTGLTSQLLLDRTAQALLHGHTTEASAASAIAGLVWLFVPVTAALTAWLKRHTLGRLDALLLTLLTLASAWTASSSLPALLAPLPTAQASAALPLGRPGLSPTLPAIPPSALAHHLAQGGYYHQPERPWTCPGPEPARWLRFPRATVAVPLPADAPMSLLDQVMHTANEWSVNRVVLLGQASPPPGPLFTRLAAPGVAIITDAPPPSALWATAWPAPRELDWLSTQPSHEQRAICVLLPQQGLTIGDLYRIGRDIAGPGSFRQCAAIAIPPTPYRPRSIQPDPTRLETPCR